MIKFLKSDFKLKRFLRIVFYKFWAGIIFPFLCCFLVFSTIGGIVYGLGYCAQIILDFKGEDIHFFRTLSGICVFCATVILTIWILNIHSTLKKIWERC